MKVVMKKQTKWNGEVLRPGDEKDVEGEAARRWINKGIAEPVTTVSTPATIPDASEPEDVLLEDLKYNELRKIASVRGIKVPRGTKKSELIALIRGEEVKADVKPASTDEKKTV